MLNSAHMVFIRTAHCIVLSQAVYSHPKITREDFPAGPTVPSATQGSSEAVMGVGAQDSESKELKEGKGRVGSKQWLW